MLSAGAFSAATLGAFKKRGGKEEVFQAIGLGKRSTERRLDNPEEHRLVLGDRQDLAAPFPIPLGLPPDDT